MTEQLVFDARTQSAKDWALWLYIGHGLSLVFSLGLLSWLPLIINYLKRDDAADTFVYSHHRWQIRSFWWFLLWGAVGFLVWITIIGIPLAVLIWSLAWIWKAYRLIRGALELSKNQAMPV